MKYYSNLKGGREVREFFLILPILTEAHKLQAFLEQVQPDMVTDYVRRHTEDPAKQSANLPTTQSELYLSTPHQWFTHASPKGHTPCTCRLNVGHNQLIPKANVTYITYTHVKGYQKESLVQLEAGLVMGQTTSHSLTLCLTTNGKKGSTFRGNVSCPSYV